MNLLEKLLRKFRFVRRLERRIERLENENSGLQKQLDEWSRYYPYPPGHFYSPLPSLSEIDAAFARGLPGPPFGEIDLNEKEQFALLNTFAAYYREQPFPEQPSEGWRYYLDNASYGSFDGLMLYCMLRHLRPRRIIEVGSGFSSAAMLDLNEHVFGGRMALTFIDPDMVRLRPLLRPEDTDAVTLLEFPVQDVPLEVFHTLEANDVLFIDSSHVSKIGSDVNRIFFEILPSLRPGVHIHIHDIAGNFDYPKDWLKQGRAWNELYLLRAFLMYNRTFSIVLFSSWLMNALHPFFVEQMPLCAQEGGGQIWLRKNDPEAEEAVSST